MSAAGDDKVPVAPECARASSEHSGTAGHTERRARAREELWQCRSSGGGAQQSAEVPAMSQHGGHRLASRHSKMASVGAPQPPRHRPHPLLPPTRRQGARLHHIRHLLILALSSSALVHVTYTSTSDAELYCTSMTVHPSSLLLLYVHVR